MRTIAILLGLMLVASTAWGQQADTPQSPDADIVVQGRRNPQEVRQFVHSVAVAAPSVGQLARWNHHLCPGVYGATSEMAQAINDQIARRAVALGLHVGAPGCRNDLTIIVTSDSDQVARAIVERRHTLLTRPNNVDGATLGEQALTAFANTPRAVRWWHVSQKMSADGYMMNDERASPTSNSALTAMESAANPTSPTSGDGMTNLVAHRSDGSRLHRATRQDFNYVLVIVDTTRLNGAPLSAVADYIAFVALAQVNPDVNAAGFATILNLFNMPPGPDRPTQLTGWDIDYLDGLYHATRNARGVAQQEGDIQRRMVAPHS